MKTKRGFTLIELLVVIAIIGMLASIVLASMSTARVKAQDVSMKGVLSGMRTAAAQYSLNIGSYGTAGTTAGSCASAPTGSIMWADRTTNLLGLIGSATTTLGTTKVDCGTSATAWSVAVQLPGGTYWCVDSQGTVRGSIAAGTAYNALTGSANAAHTAAGATACN